MISSPSIDELPTLLLARVALPLLALWPAVEARYSNRGALKMLELIAIIAEGGCLLEASSWLLSGTEGEGLEDRRGGL
jgi:hypothetical protein